MGDLSAAPGISPSKSANSTAFLWLHAPSVGGWRLYTTWGWDLDDLACCNMSKINVACLLAPLILRFSCYTMELFFSKKPAAKGFGRSTNTNTTPLLHTMTHGIRVAHFDNSYDNLALQSGDYKACDQMFEALKLLPVFATKNPFGFFHFFGEAGRRGKEKNQASLMSPTKISPSWNAWILQNLPESHHPSDPLALVEGFPSPAVFVKEPEMDLECQGDNGYQHFESAKSGTTKSQHSEDKPCLYSHCDLCLFWHT